MRRGCDAFAYRKVTAVRIVHRSGSARPLPKRAKPFPDIRFEDHGHHFDLYDYLAIERVAGLLVTTVQYTTFGSFGAAQADMVLVMTA